MFGRCLQQSIGKSINVSEIATTPGGLTAVGLFFVFGWLSFSPAVWGGT